MRYDKMIAYVESQMTWIENGYDTEGKIRMDEAWYDMNEEEKTYVRNYVDGHHLDALRESLDDLRYRRREKNI